MGVFIFPLVWVDSKNDPYDSFGVYDSFADDSFCSSSHVWMRENQEILHSQEYLVPRSHSSNSPHCLDRHLHGVRWPEDTHCLPNVQLAPSSVLLVECSQFVWVYTSSQIVTALESYSKADSQMREFGSPSGVRLQMYHSQAHRVPLGAPDSCKRAAS